MDRQDKKGKRATRQKDTFFREKLKVKDRSFNTLPDG